MAVVFLTHAEKQLVERRVSKEFVLEVLENPDQQVPGDFERTVYHKRYFDTIHNEELLLRIVVEEQEDYVLVMSVYKTSKMRKYWSGEL